MMDERSTECVSSAIISFLDSLVAIADEGNYDRDSFIKASVDMLQFMLEVCTFNNHECE